MDSAGFADTCAAGANTNYSEYLDFVDALSDVEIQSRYRTTCRSNSHREEDGKLMEAYLKLSYILENSSQRG